MRLRSGLCPKPCWGAYNAPPDLVVGWDENTAALSWSLMSINLSVLRHCWFGERRGISACEKLTTMPLFSMGQLVVNHCSMFICCTVIVMVRRPLIWRGIPSWKMLYRLQQSSLITLSIRSQHFSFVYLYHVTLLQECCKRITSHGSGKIFYSLTPGCHNFDFLPLKYLRVLCGISRWHNWSVDS